MGDGLFPARLLNPIENNLTALQFIRLNLGYHIIFNSTHSLLFIVMLLSLFLGLFDMGKQLKGSYFSVLA